MATADKYDRQLRLWGPRGQRKLMKSHILLVNANAVGTETLKNLVLPGVGKFTILDDKIITPQDASINFFLPESEVGRYRADVARETLSEMNPDVEGLSLASNLAKELSDDPSFVEKFSVVILTNPSLSDIKLASEVCWNLYVPLVIVQSYGFLGQCRLQLREHDIVESKPDPEQIYLRLNAPFESLRHFYDQFDFSKQSPKEFAHAPYMAILNHQLEMWACRNEGRKPTTRAEKKEFKDIIKAAGAPTEYHEDGSAKISFLRENYKEAMQNVSRFLEPVVLPENLVDLFENESLMTMNASNPKINNFKVLLVALKEYIDGVGEGVHCPLSGVLPDMTATSDVFMNLQKIYQDKAEQDRNVFRDFVLRVLLRLNRPIDDISDEEIQIFCRNILNLRYLSSECSIHERMASPRASFAGTVLSEETYWDDPSQTPLLFHYLLMAADQFHDSNGRYPGDFDLWAHDGFDFSTKLAADEEEVWQIIRQIASDHNVPCKFDATTAMDDEAPHLSFEHAQELARYGGTELHNISSLLGGVAAQECVKIVTHLFVPLHNCYLYNGIAGCSSTFEL